MSLIVLGGGRDGVGSREWRRCCTTRTARSPRTALELKEVVSRSALLGHGTLVGMRRVVVILREVPCLDLVALVVGL